MKRYIVLIGILCLSGVVTLKAQQERNQGIIWSSLRGLEYTVKGCINIGGKGIITVDGTEYEMHPRDGIYIGAIAS